MVAAFAMCLLTALIFAWATRNRRMAFAAGVLSLNWLACWAWARWWPDLGMDPVVLTAFDGLAALALLVPALRCRAPDWYIAIVALYLVQLCAHAASIINPGAEASHWTALSVLAWAQFAVVWAGGTYEMVGVGFRLPVHLGNHGPAVRSDGRAAKGGEA